MRADLKWSVYGPAPVNVAVLVIGCIAGCVGIPGGDRGGHTLKAFHPKAQGRRRAAHPGYVIPGAPQPEGLPQVP